MFVIIGWIVALAAVFGVFIAHGGNIGVVLKALPFEMAAIGGAALGAFIANNQPKVLKATMKGLGQCFKGSKYTKARYMELMALMYDILQKARKEGLMSIEKDVEDPHSSPLFQKYPAVGNDHHVSEFITMCTERPKDWSRATPRACNTVLQVRGSRWCSSSLARPIPR